MNDLPPQADAVINATTDANIKRGAGLLVLKWKGSKTPRGLSIGGVDISHAQHGIVTGVNGKTLGTYTRTMEFGGPNKDEHEMFVVPSV